jgi:hypothetical protein
MRKNPVFFTPGEQAWYEQTPKRVLYALARDYAMQNVGEEHAFGQPDCVLAELKDRQQIIVSNPLDQA